MAVVAVVLVSILIAKSLEKHNDRKAERLEGHGKVLYDYDAAGSDLPPAYNMPPAYETADRKTQQPEKKRSHRLHFHGFSRNHGSEAAAVNI